MWQHHKIKKFSLLCGLLDARKFFQKEFSAQRIAEQFSRTQNATKNHKHLGMNKKAVSLIVSYVLLIVIAIGVSVLVYNYLKLYVPGENKKCPTDVYLVVDEAKCSYSQKTLNITLTNRGLFNISAVFIRVGPQNKSVKLQINAGNETLLRPLAPGRSDNYPSLKIPSNITLTQDSNNEVEIQPALIINKFLVPCENAIATQTFECLP